MQRRNGVTLAVRQLDGPERPEYLGRKRCQACGKLVPRGADRPFCIEHAPYIKALRSRIVDDRSAA